MKGELESTRVSWQLTVNSRHILGDVYVCKYINIKIRYNKIVPSPILVTKGTDVPWSMPV